MSQIENIVVENVVPHVAKVMLPGIAVGGRIKGFRKVSPGGPCSDHFRTASHDHHAAQPF